MTERVVLAYSGRLDTSVAIPYLAEQGGGEILPSRMASARDRRLGD